MFNIVKFLINKNLIYQSINVFKLQKLTQYRKIRLYVGFDCTSNSLHLGSIIIITILKFFQKFGHQPIILLGTATTVIGDPSGRYTQRNIYINNIISIKKNFIKRILLCFFNNYSLNKVVFIDNKHWLFKLKYLNFLINYGKHFVVNKMLNSKNIYIRLNNTFSNLNFSEFNYILLQAFDFYYLYKKFKCVLQIGGADQWNNIIYGIFLIKKKINIDSFCLTFPIFTNIYGIKFGKTFKNSTYVNNSFFSIIKFWNFWRNISDYNLYAFFTLFTNFSYREIKKITYFATINNSKILLSNIISQFHINIY